MGKTHDEFLGSNALSSVNLRLQDFTRLVRRSTRISERIGVILGDGKRCGRGVGDVSGYGDACERGKDM